MNACEICDDPNAIAVGSSGHEILVRDLYLVREVEPRGLLASTVDAKQTWLASLS